MGKIQKGELQSPVRIKIKKKLHTQNATLQQFMLNLLK